MQDLINKFDNDDWTNIVSAMRRFASHNKLEASFYPNGHTTAKEMTRVGDRLELLAGLIDGQLEETTTRPDEITWVTAPDGGDDAWLHGIRIAFIKFEKDNTRPYTVIMGHIVRGYKTMTGAKNYVRDYARPLIDNKQDS